MSKQINYQKLEALIDSAIQQIKTALFNEFDEVMKSMKKDELEKLKQKEQDVLQRQIQETKISAAIEQSRMPSGDRYFQSKKLQKLAYVQNRLLNVG